MKRIGLGVAAIVAAASVLSLVHAQAPNFPSTKNGEWAYYTADVKGTRYSPLDQINATNFNQLEVAWRFKTDNLGTRPEYKLEGTPLMVKGVVYTTGGTSRSVVALDAKSGELMWVYSLREGARATAAPRQLSGRGLSYWTDGKGDERVLFVTTGYNLVALNAHTGAPVRQFGKDGIVDLKVGAVVGKGEQIPLETGEIGLHSTPTVAKDVVIVGSSFREGLTVKTHNNTKGLVRAYDVRTGKTLWTFNTIPRPGEFGSDTWEKESWAINGNTGVWSQITVDEDAGLVYLPVEDPTSDLYGGHRPGNNLFGDSLVCLDLKTGQRKWHFQIVHHPIWDYDMPAAPILIDINVNGKPIKAVAQATKQGMLYVFDRISGLDYVMGTAGQQFRPILGGGEGLAADAPQRGGPVGGPTGPPPAPPAGRGAEGRGGAAGGRGGAGGGEGFGGAGTIVQGLPILKPPYGVVVGINLDKGTLEWSTPHGDTPDNIRNSQVLRGINVPKTGQTGNVGVVVTKTLVIVADPLVTTTPDQPRGAMLRAYGKLTGKEVGAVYMPAAQSGSPMTYMIDGKQYVIVAVSGGAYSGEYIAYALPNTATRTSTGR